jgi:hypothetical protein
MIIYRHHLVWWKSLNYLDLFISAKSRYVLPIYDFQGGSRAYVASVAQISALNELNLLGNIKYIGGISGGSFHSYIYISVSE